MDYPLNCTVRVQAEDHVKRDDDDGNTLVRCGFPDVRLYATKGYRDTQSAVNVVVILRFIGREGTSVSFCGPVVRVDAYGVNFADRAVHVYGEGYSYFFNFFCVLRGGVRLAGVSVKPVVRSFMACVRSSIAANDFINGGYWVDDFVRAVVATLVGADIQAVVGVFREGRNVCIYR